MEEKVKTELSEKSILVSIKLPESMVLKIEALAKQRGLRRHSYINMILTDHINNNVPEN